MNLEAAITRYINVHPPSNLVKREAQVNTSNLIKAIVGPRRAGKTTFMLQLKDSIAQPESNKIFLNCEDINLVGLREEHLEQLERTWLKVYSPSSSNDIFLFIDEVQNIPSWERWLRTLHDYGRYKIFVAGSTSELSTSKTHSALRGRAVNITILPFSFKEFLTAKNASYARYMDPEQQARIELLFEEYVKYGGYPSVVLTDEVQQKIMILKEIYDTVMQRDIIEKYGIRKIAEFKIILAYLMSSVCRQVSIRKIASWVMSQNVTASRQTVLEYLEHAEDIFFLFRLPKYSKKPKERAVSPKLYCVDSGLLHINSIEYSKLLENQVFVELMRRKTKTSYWIEDSGREVDFVFEQNGELQIIQVCMSLFDPSTLDRELKALAEASRALHPDKISILTLNEERTFSIGSNRVYAIPAWKWFLGLE
jgi:predicted AAA+ superfamily ATPase